MENSMSQFLVGYIIKRSLIEMKENTDRGIRNFADMEMQFLNGKFREKFFTAVQTMLQNQNGAYYQLVRDVVTHADIDRLYTFGMNLGYNGCTVGAQRIRENKKSLGCNVPWTVPLQISMDNFAEKEAKYQAAIRSGEGLGIYSWMFFCGNRPKYGLPFIKAHPDSAFFLFCDPEELTSEFLKDAAGSYNLMLVIRYNKEAGELCSRLRELGLLYSAWVPYGPKNLESIVNRDLFYSVQQLSPVFTVLLPERGCPDDMQQLVCQTVQQARREQSYRTILWDLQRDNNTVGQIISGDACGVFFDKDGNLCSESGPVKSVHHNLFQNDLKDISVSACPKKGKGASRAELFD